jgi:acetyltransferase-like isoleucine patch superfamily enzyme
MVKQQWKNLMGENNSSQLDRFKDWELPVIDDGKLTKYNWVVQNVSGFKLGNKTDIGAFTYINAKLGVEIGDKVQIGSHCSIYSVSTIDNTSGIVKLLKNCKIGSHSTILPGVTIGENTIIGAHSLVNSDIPPNVVALGVPAKVVREINL